MDALRKVKKDKTIVMITHWMTTARKADRIYVMDSGKIVESGKHSELIKNKDGLYKKLWDLQVKGPSAKKRENSSEVFLDAV